MAEENKNIGTSDMPEQKTINYVSIYKIAPVFVSDLKLVLKDYPYIEVKQFLDLINSNNGELPVALLNEFINKLARLPYKTIEPLMRAIENKDTFSKYFILKQEPTKQPV